MITSRDDVIDRVAGLEAGADDYIGKPFHPREVLARVRTVLRRLDGRGARGGKAGGSQGESLGGVDTIYDFAGFELHVHKRRVVAPIVGDVPLTTAEYDLLLAFVTHPGHVLDRDRLMDLAKGRAWAASDRSVDQQVARLRRKVEADPARPALIKSVRGAGYVLAAEVRRR
jgi:two-component system phosphate regulon response regulator OmpR